MYDLSPDSRPLLHWRTRHLQREIAFPPLAGGDSAPCLVAPRESVATAHPHPSGSFSRHR